MIGHVRHAALILALSVLAAGCGGSSSSGNQENGPIALSGQRSLSGAPGLFLREPDGTLRRLTTAKKARDVVPAFSHDGKRIAYVHMMTGPHGGTGPLMVVNADGSDAHQIGNIVAGALQFSWSPDDKSLVYSGLPSGLWTVGVDGSRARRIFMDVGDASWSADDRIVIARPARG